MQPILNFNFLKRFLLGAAILGALVDTSVGGLTLYATCDNHDYQWGRQYACIVKDMTVTDETDRSVVSSEVRHLPGKEQKDVEAIHIEDQLTRFMPTRIESIYWNMITLVVENSRLEKLDNFVIFKGMKFVNFENNLIKNLPVGIFRDSVGLEYISMNDNKIDKLESRIFTGMPKLRVVKFSNNRLRSLDGGLFANNLNIEEIYFNGNRIASVGTELTVHLKKLNAANFDSNVCINEAFFGLAEVEKLTARFTAYCSGQCDKMINAESQISTLSDQNEELSQMNDEYKIARELNCISQRMMEASDSSSSSSE